MNINIQALTIVGAALLRSFLGWLKKSVLDGKIDKFEWKELIATVIRVGFFGVIVIYLPGLNLSWIDASAVALVADFVFNAIRKLRK